MRTKTISLLSSIAFLFLFSSCARMGNPDGGWYDDAPPRVLSSVPEDKGTGVKTNKVTIYFDEFIKLEDAANKVVVSPPQLEMPEIKTSGKRIVVELKDTLKENTTYTIDFSDAISDNNEGNPMGNYTYTFSTGTQIDTLEVSGYVLDASNLEPIKGILVGLYDDLSDTAFTTKPLMRVSRTDSRGRFVVRGIKEGSYRVYALQDADGNYLFNQKSEMLAYSHEAFTPTSRPDIRQDTIWRDSLHIDSIARIPYIHYYPDDIVLLAFQEKQTDRYLLKTERTDERKLGFFFSYGNEQLPVIRGLNFDADSAFITEPSQQQDTIYYWLRDTALINRDSLFIEAQYLMTDSAGILISRTDTIEAIPKMSYERRTKLKEKELEKWQKEQERKKKRDEPYDSVMPRPRLEMQLTAPSSLDPDRSIFIEAPTPLVRCDTAAIHLYSKIDSLWYRSAFQFHPVEGKLRLYELAAEWRPGIEYSLEIDSAAFEDIYGYVSGEIKQGIRVKSLDDYATLVINLSGIADTAAIVVQLLNSSDAVVKQVRADGNTAELYYITPGKYYMRAFIDTNGNNTWDTGNYAADRQAEAVYYYPKDIDCKAKWDLTLAWNLTARKRNQQKPGAITKQKPDKEKKLRNRNADRAAQLGIKYIR